VLNFTDLVAMEVTPLQLEILEYNDVTRCYLLYCTLLLHNKLLSIYLSYITFGRDWSTATVKLSTWRQHVGVTPSDPYELFWKLLSLNIWVVIVSSGKWFQVLSNTHTHKDSSSMPTHLCVGWCCSTPFHIFFNSNKPALNVVSRNITKLTYANSKYLKRNQNFIVQY
jgi:hypothetical protein